MFGWSTADARRRYVEALKQRDAAYLKYINSDAREFGYQDNKWSLEKANGEVAEWRRVLQIT